MQDIREIELEIVDQTQTPRYISRFEQLLYVPAFTQKNFHYVHTVLPTQGTSRNLQLPTWSIQLLSQHNHLYSRGKVQSHNSITSTKEGQGI